MDPISLISNIRNLSSLYKKAKGAFSVPTRTETLPMDAGTYQTPSGQSPSLSSVYKGEVAPIKKSSTSTVTKSTPVAPVKPAAVPPTWVNPATGGFYTSC